MDNLAYDYYDDIPYEIINGEKVFMAPSAGYNHVTVAGNIFVKFREYLRGKRCVAFPDHMDVHLGKKDVFEPDVMIVCDRSTIHSDGVYGAPDLVVEVLSPSTAKRDRGYKMKTYAKHGVREYWLVDTGNRSIEVYLLEDGAFELDYIYYAKYPRFLLADKTDEEKAAVRKQIKTSLYDDLIIPLDEIFTDLFDEITGVFEETAHYDV